MNAPKGFRTCLFSCIVALALPPGAAKANPPVPRDGQHDFDFEIGTGKTHLSRRLHPLTGSNHWVPVEPQLREQRQRYLEPTDDRRIVFSADGGKTWETNWIATDTRLKEGPDKAR